MRFLHISDTHLFADEDAVLYGQPTAASLQRVLEAVKKGGWPPDGIIATGDLTHDETESGYDRFRDMLGGLGCPVHCVPGNHDIPDLMYSHLTSSPFTVNGAVNAGGWQILMLDSTVPRSDDGMLGPSELGRLEKALAENDGRPILICLHHNPVPMRSEWLDRMILKDADAFFSVVERHTSVRAVLWGHVHQPFDAMRGPVRLMATPSTFAQFEPNTERFAIDRKPAAWRWLDLHPDGSLDTELCWLETAAAG